jgi:hypothetical protein
LHSTKGGSVANARGSLKLPVIGHSYTAKRHELLMCRQLAISELPFSDHMSRFNYS